MSEEEKCEICGKISEWSRSGRREVEQLENIDGDQHVVCGDCVHRLIEFMKMIRGTKE